MEVQMNPVNWFEIPVGDLARAKKFYEAVFGFELNLQDMGMMKMAWFPMPDKLSPGATGSLVKAEGYVPSHSGTVVYFTVDDIDARLGKVQANGGKVLLPKMGIGEYGSIAQFEDSEGNRVALHSMK